MLRNYHGAGILFWRKSDTNTIEILLGKRSSHIGHGAGLWSTFGGKQNPGESYIECACREAIEETAAGMDIKISEPFFTLESVPLFSRHIPYLYHFKSYECEVNELPVGWPKKNWEHDRICWFPVSELPEPLHREAKRLVRALGKITFRILLEKNND